MCAARWLMVSIIALGVACSSDIEEWDYRAAIRKDVKELTKVTCPPGKHKVLDCRDKMQGGDCRDICVPNAQ